MNTKTQNLKTELGAAQEDTMAIINIDEIKYNFFIIVKTDDGINKRAKVETRATTVKTKRQAMMIAMDMLFDNPDSFKAIIRDWDNMNVIGEITI